MQRTLATNLLHNNWQFADGGEEYQSNQIKFKTIHYERLLRKITITNMCHTESEGYKIVKKNI